MFHNRNVYKSWFVGCFMETLFRRALGDTAKIRVLEFFIEGRELEYSLSDIVEGAGIGRTTLFRIFEDLLEVGIVVPTRVIGNAKLYKLNMENVFVQKMVEVFDEVVLKGRRFATGGSLALPMDGS